LHFVAYSVGSERQRGYHVSGACKAVWGALGQAASGNSNNNNSLVAIEPHCPGWSPQIATIINVIKNAKLHSHTDRAEEH
jgi:hypothetical protein